ncbi:hypothetical protein ILYODFUR_015165 [Ilyodon furcidens]|uniref:Uncharacterized protein n=1 Tax=Ilyodon furcidens TaxID=33524 RepID=A0ABV0UG85_9TELE
MLALPVYHKVLVCVCVSAMQVYISAAMLFGNLALRPRQRRAAPCLKRARVTVLPLRTDHSRFYNCMQSRVKHKGIFEHNREFLALSESQLSYLNADTDDVTINLTHYDSVIGYM